MQVYKNLNNNSGIRFYQLEINSIIVEYKTGKRYTYSYQSAGPSNIEQMKLLALAGSGLNKFIANNVKFLYVK